MSLLSLTATGFDAAVAPTTRTLVVAFLAEWCSPCRSLRPTLAAIAGRLPDGVQLAEVDADLDHGLAKRCHVEVLPTLVAFRASRPILRLTGARPEAELLGVLSRLARSATPE